MKRHDNAAQGFASYLRDGRQDVSARGPFCARLVLFVMSTIEQGLKGSTVVGDSTVDVHHDLVGEFRRRFPLFDGVDGRFGEDAPRERIPWFFGFILASAAKSGAGACCLVLEKTNGTTALAAILLGLVRLQRDIPDLVERYAKNALTRGQRVRARPSEFVYEYEGVWEQHPKFFRLKLLGEKAWRSFPLADVLRLEPTDRVRPKGTGGCDLGTFERSPLDCLLDLSTCGNISLIENTVLVQMPRAHLAKVADATTLAPKGAEQFARLSCFLPWGFIGQDGTLEPNDQYQVVGEPLIAATGVPEDLALACSRADTGTKTVLADGARRLAKNLQTFDDIAERQRLVILASPDESEELDLLKNRGCGVWHLSADEVLIGEAHAGRRTRASLVGATLRAAAVRRRCSVATVDCNDDVLQAAAASLEGVAEIIEGREEVEEVEEALGGLFRVLFECSECCFGVGEGVVHDLQAARDGMARHAKWLEALIVSALRDAVDALERAVTTGSGGEKAEALLCILAERDGRWAVAARSPRSAERLREDLGDLGTDVAVLHVSAFNGDHEYDGIIVPAWPNDQRFTRLRNLSVAPDIRVLAYPFESKWVLRHQARERARSHMNRLDAEELSSITGIAPQLLFPLNDAPSEEEDSQGREVAVDLPVFRLENRIAGRHVTQPLVAGSGEDSRQAHLVRFHGGCYALLTEWSELPVLNELIDGSRRDSAKLISVAASGLSTGDLVLFRAGGDKEFIRMIAEEGLGTEEYSRIRHVAERWKSPLPDLGDGPTAIQRRLAKNGLERTSATIAGWLGNPDRIGPGDYDDIEVIARVAGDTELLSIKDEVRSAISRIRGAHLTAGMHLTQLILGEIGSRVDELGDQPTLLDLDYGHAWVVQIASVETKRQAYPANQVNRLLWAADRAF